MPKRKEPELDPKEQFKRFVETAKEHGVDESEDAIEEAFRKLVKNDANVRPSNRVAKKNHPTKE